MKELLKYYQILILLLLFTVLRPKIYKFVRTREFLRKKQKKQKEYTPPTMYYRMN